MRCLLLKFVLGARINGPGGGSLFRVVSLTSCVCSWQRFVPSPEATLRSKSIHRSDLPLSAPLSVRIVGWTEPLPTAIASFSSIVFAFCIFLAKVPAARFGLKVLLGALNVAAKQSIRLIRKDKGN